MPNRGDLGAGPAGAALLDPGSRAWVRDLRGGGPEHEAALARLHDLLLRVALAELRRRGPPAGIDGAELDDLAHQAASDALLAILAKLDGFRGESRFTTWAYKFAVLEVSGKIGRHFWRRHEVRLDVEDWDRLPDRFGFGAVERVEYDQLLAGLRVAVDEVLSERQRRVFVALVLNGVPLDALVAELGTSRSAIYKTLFDARRKLRSRLVARGLMDSRAPPRS